MKNPPEIIVQLIHIEGPMKGKEQEFSEGTISIGRHPSCHLCFPADQTNVSRNHADIVRDGNKFKLADRSSNGTFVNGKKVSDVYLKDGDVLEFSSGGPKVCFLTEIKKTPSGGGSVAPPPEKPINTPQTYEDHDRPATPIPVQEKHQEPIIQRVKVPLIIQYGATLRTFKELPITIGKSPNCEFIIELPAIFDQQARIFFDQDQYWIKDLTGQQAVQINKQSIEHNAPLRPNDEVALGPQGPFFKFLGEGRFVEIE